MKRIQKLCTTLLLASCMTSTLVITAFAKATVNDRNTAYKIDASNISSGAYHLKEGHLLVGTSVHNGRNKAAGDLVLHLGNCVKWHEGETYYVPKGTLLALGNAGDSGDSVTWMTGPSGWKINTRTTHYTWAEDGTYTTSWYTAGGSQYNTRSFNIKQVNNVSTVVIDSTGTTKGRTIPEGGQGATMIVTDTNAIGYCLLVKDGVAVSYFNGYGTFNMGAWATTNPVGSYEVYKINTQGSNAITSSKSPDLYNSNWRASVDYNKSSNEKNPRYTLMDSFTIGHQYGAWKSDASKHWKECSGCGSKTSEGLHTLDAAGKCTTCGGQ